MTQRLTEELEYSDLLDRAACCENSLEQICYVAAFSVSCYASTAVRTGKPFNPMLGETYELDRYHDMGWTSLAEQVRCFRLTMYYFQIESPNEWSSFCSVLSSVIFWTLGVSKKV